MNRFRRTLLGVALVGMMLLLPGAGPVIGQDSDVDLGDAVFSPLHTRSFSPEGDPSKLDVSGIGSVVLEASTTEIAELGYRTFINQLVDDQDFEEATPLSFAPQFGEESLVLLGTQTEEGAASLDEDELYAEEGYGLSLLVARDETRIVALALAAKTPELAEETTLEVARHILPWTQQGESHEPDRAGYAGEGLWAFLPSAEEVPPYLTVINDGIGDVSGEERVPQIKVPTPSSIPGQAELKNVHDVLAINTGFEVEYGRHAARIKELTPVGQELIVDGHSIFVFIFSSIEARQTATEALNLAEAELVGPSGSPVTSEPLSLAEGSNVAVIFVGGDAEWAKAIKLAISELP